MLLAPVGNVVVVVYARGGGHWFGSFSHGACVAETVAAAVNESNREDRKKNKERSNQEGDHLDPSHLPPFY